MTDSAVEQMRAMSSEAVQILAALESHPNPQEIDSNINRARQILQFADTIPIAQQPNRFREEFHLVSSLQGVAYHDPDSGSVRDIAEWCVQRWLRLLQHYPDSWEIFQGRYIPIFAPSYVLFDYV